jgi:hypothetical protein
LWADGLEGRSDGLTWACSDFSADGTHPANAGRSKVADSLLEFFKADATTQPWFVSGTTGLEAASLPNLSLVVTPNPTSGEVVATFTPAAGERWRAEVMDLAGRRVSTLDSGIGNGQAHSIRFRGTHPGVYWLRVVTGQSAVARRFVRLAE